jgi:hypothetical protein
VPHRSSPSFDREWWDGFRKMYQHQKPYIMLTDIDVLIVNDDQRSIQRSTEHTFESMILTKQVKRSQ